MSIDQNTPKTTNRPSKRRGFKPGLVAAALAGALLIPAAAVTIAAEPWADGAAVAASANGKSEKRQTAAEAESEMRECRDETNAYGNGEVSLALVKKLATCLELLDSAGDPESPITVKEAQKLIKQGLQAFETAGFKREQIPGILSMLSESRMVETIAGERANDLIGLMAGSQIIEDYANREIQGNEASKKIAELLVTIDKAGQK
ncbi:MULTISPECIES: hypothetical protein [Citricoccus]|uniref:hypothetical protein n=1 Tax=Citricoccus TaxID=169133 RepID=UPI000255EFF4|nr:hypothetical protein [Citricoccus sp. CH26A]